MIEIIVEDDVKGFIKINSLVFKKLIKKIFKDFKRTFSSVTYIISNDIKLSQLKKDFFNQNVLTDVITFNLEEANEPVEGEIYISFERIKENASNFNQEVSTELNRIFIHGTLHLIGFDDQTKVDKTKMTNLENKYIKNIENLFE